MMSTVLEITTAIKALSPAEREQLLKELRLVLPELDGDAEWKKIIHDPRPRPALTALGDEIEAQLRVNPNCFPQMSVRVTMDCRAVAQRFDDDL